MNVAHLTLFLGVLAKCGHTRDASYKERPVTKVIRLLQDMKVELEKEKADDDAVYESLSCWCKTNDEEKSKAIELGEAKRDDLKASMAEYEAKIAELREGLASTTAKLRGDQDALDAATSIRFKEGKAFHEEEKSLLDTIQSIKQALVVLSKHHPSLEQLRSIARTLDALKVGELTHMSIGSDKLNLLKSFLQGAQQETSDSNLRRIPGFQSYTPQSGQIFGILKQMQEDFEADLQQAQQREMASKAESESLKVAKAAELDAGMKQRDQLRQDDADFRQKNAQAYEEYQDTLEQLDIDREFLRNLRKRCAETEKEYQARTQSRLEEIVAVEDTIQFLNTDDAFANFDKTVNTAFLQTRSSSSLSGARLVEARKKAAKVLRKAGNPQLALLAGRLSGEAFEKVIAAIDKMIGELTKQQQEEVEHKDWCKSELHANSKNTAKEEHTKESLVAKIKDTTATIKKLTESIELKTKEIAEMEAEMKKASEIREAENADFQQAVMDHMVTQTILKKAVDRMKQVYALMQKPGAPHMELSGTKTDPGSGPARFTKYEKSSTGGRVISMMETIMADSKKLENEARAGEEDAQAEYEGFMKDSNKSIKEYQHSIVNMSENKAKAEETLELAKTDLSDTLTTLESLNSMLGDLKQSCDFMLENFDARQDARANEIEALREAKAILSGSK